MNDDAVKIQDPITHGFGFEGTSENVWRRIAIGKSASGKFHLKIESRFPGDEAPRIQRMAMSRDGLEMLQAALEEALAKMERHPSRGDVTEL